MDQYIYRPNRVPIYQNVFQRGPTGVPVHLRGPYDRGIYRFAMALSVVGMGITVYALYGMSTNTIKKA